MFICSLWAARNILSEQFNYTSGLQVKIKVHLRWFPCFGPVTKNNQDLIFNLSPLKPYLWIEIECTTCEITIAFKTSGKISYCCLSKHNIACWVVLCWDSVCKVTSRETWLPCMLLCPINATHWLKEKQLFSICLQVPTGFPKYAWQN